MDQRALCPRPCLHQECSTLRRLAMTSVGKPPEHLLVEEEVPVEAPHAGVKHYLTPSSPHLRVSSGTGPCARRDDTTSAEKDSTPVAPQRSRIRAHIQEAAACAVGHEQRVFVGEEDRPDHGDEPPSTCLTSTLPTCSWRPRGSR